MRSFPTTRRTDTSSPATDPSTRMVYSTLKPLRYQKMTTANRDALLSLMMLVRPALATQSFIPAWTHIRFAGGSATTFNDTTSISVKVPVEGLAGVCVPGELFIKTLSSFNAESVLLQDNDTSLVLTAGRSKMKVPVLGVEDFKMPVLKGKPAEVDLTDDILEGVKQCLFSVGTDPTHPSQMGVTLEAESGKAVLYSTDNITLSRCSTKSTIKLPGDAPVILPSFFCEQMLTIAKAFPDDDMVLEVYPGALQIRFGKKATLLSKTLVDLEPLDFGAAFGKYLDVANAKKSLSVLPPSFDASFNRALLVLANETDKAARVTVTKGGAVELYAKSQLGESTDDFVVEQAAARKPFHVDPALMLRGAKTCGSVAFYDRVVLLASDDGTFLHLIAHCAG